MNYGSNDKSRHAETIIRNHVLWSSGASFFIPIPIADIFAVSALQLDMIRQLARVYGIDFAETQGKAIITSLTSSTLARAGARSLIKLVPGLGTVIGGVTVSVFNGASTYALGQVFKRHFDGGGTFLDFDTERLKKIYREQFEKGKDITKEWQTEEEQAKADGKSTATEPAPAAPAASSQDATVQRLKELADLREKGVITDEEFAALKQKIING